MTQIIPIASEWTLKQIKVSKIASHPCRRLLILQRTLLFAALTREGTIPISSYTTMASSITAPTSTSFLHGKVDSLVFLLERFIFACFLAGKIQLFDIGKGLICSFAPIYGCSFFFLVSQKEMGFSAFASTSPVSAQRCQKTVSKRIFCSVVAPQQSERKPSTTGSVL